MRAFIAIAILTLLAGCTGTSGGTLTPPLPTDLDYSGLRVEGPSRFDATSLSAVWATPELSGTSIAIPKDLVEKYWIVNFEVNLGGVRVPLMALKTTEGNINIMPRICVPCRSEGWHLKNDVLICDACGTTFDATTGDGIQGACVGYPKAMIAYTESGGKLVMDASAVGDAYQKTMQPGRP